MTNRKSSVNLCILLFILTSSIILPILYENYNFTPVNQEIQKDIHSSAQKTITQQWIKNPTFEDPIEPIWYWENGTEGDNSDMNATTSTGQANYEVTGETLTFTVVSGIINNSANSQGWKQFNKEGFLQPDTAEIRSYGCFAYHFWNDDPNQFPSVHWKTNLSVPIDMSDYVITSASLDVIVNATVSSNVDTPNDADWETFAIGDSVTFYAEISDLGYNSPIYTVASNKTKYLGQQNFGFFPTILSYSDYSLDTVNEIDIITALNSAFDKDPTHSNFTLTLGIDIYSEDNLGSNDPDTFDELIIKTCNLTFTVKKKIDQFTTLSWNQIGDKITGSSIQITDANFNFKFKIDKTWPTSAPLSEIRFFINNKTYEEGILKLSSAGTSFQEARAGGFNVTNLISADVNISVSIEVFLKDSFELDQVYIISIDDVYLNISYIETFPDYGTELQLFLNNENKTLDPVYQIPILNTLNITITYTDNQTGAHIDAATVNIEGKVSGSLNESLALEHYYIIVDTIQLGLGVNVLTVSAQKDNYETKAVQIFVEVIERETELKLLVDNIERSSNETIDFQFNENVNITVFYTDSSTVNHINGASVSLLGIDNFTEVSNQYYYSLSTNDLNQGINILTIFAYLSDYESQTLQFFINVFERAAQLLLFVDSIQRYDSDSINSQFNELINITVYYRDDLTSEHLTGANVDLLGFGSLVELNNQFNYSLDTDDLNQGINILTIFAQLNNYQSKTIQFFINIQQRATDIQLFIDSIQKYPSDTINTQFDETLNITVLYLDSLTTMHLSGASVELIEIGTLDETTNQYNISINTNILEKGINILTIFAQLDGFQPKTIQFFINVDERAAQLLLFVDSIQRYDSDSINSQFNELINITVYYRDDLTGEHLTGANVDLLGFGSLVELNNQFNYSLDTDDLNQGINILTIFAQLNNYQSKTIQFFINIQQRATDIQLFVDSIQKYPSDTINTQFDEILNITVLYLDSLTTMHLSGASVELIGIGILDETTNQYNMSINTNILEKGINILTIFAQLDGFQPKTIQFFINVDERATELLLFINGVQKSQSDTIQFEADEIINITLIYRDQLTVLPLSGANVELLGLGTLDESLNQYNITINSNDLEQGINILTIFAQLTNYQPKSIQFFIDVVERATQIILFFNGDDNTTDPVINLPIGSLLNLTIKYLDNQTGVEISGATLQLIGESLIVNLTENVILSQYSIMINTSNLGVGDKLFTIVAQMLNYQITTINVRITINRINALINSLSGENHGDINPREDFRIQIILNNTDFGGIIKKALVTYVMIKNGLKTYAQGELIDPDNDGVYEVLLESVPAGSYLITISAYAGENYEFESLDIILNALAEPGLNITFIALILAVGLVGLGTFFISYQKHFKFPPKVRKMRKLRKKISKGKKLKPITLQTRDNIIESEISAKKQFLELDKLEENTQNITDKLEYIKKNGGNITD